MFRINNKPVWLFFAILITVMSVFYLFNKITPPQRSPQRIDEIEGKITSYFEIIDTNGNVIMETGLPVSKDDEFINEDDYHYIVTNVEGNKATARIKTQQNAPKHSQESYPVLSAIVYSKTDFFSIPKKKKRVVVYHTHTDESYIPTSGTASQKKGGDIINVGKALKNALSNANIEAFHNTQNHYPHDINAYHRSRKTLVKLLKEGPDAAFDIHRDAAPASAYHTTINGIDTARVMIVVGRSNPLMQTNLGYAKRVKKVCDKAHPGLIRGIFIGRGDYNQDLYPSALLFEIGSHNNSLAMAERGARSLADAIATAFAETEK